MESKFKPPINVEEFIKRADPVTVQAAKSVINALRVRRAAAVKNIDEELLFYKRVIDYKETGNASYEGDKGTTA